MNHFNTASTKINIFLGDESTGIQRGSPNWKVHIADAEKAVNSLFTSFRGDEVATSPDGKESMDIGSDDASNDVVECSDGKEATGSDKEIKGHLVD